LPFLYVRPKPKEHGLGNQIEGSVEPGQKVLVIEDLVSTGKSSLQVCDVLKAAGIEIVGMVSIFNYGFVQATTAFQEAGVKLISLTNYPALIALAVDQQHVSAELQSTLMDWRENPSTWNRSAD